MNKELIRAQMALLIQIVRSIQIKRALSEVNPDSRLNFWRIIQGAFLDVPVLDWCKVFGSDAEPTHWKAVVGDLDEFRGRLFAHLGISRDEWSEYWWHMKDYRDEFVAHYEAGSDIGTYPTLDLALRSSCFYHDYLLGILNEGKIDVSHKFQTLEEYSERFYESSKEIAAAAIEATSGIKEKY